MEEIDGLKRILGEALQIGDRSKGLTERSRLLGALPEFDSVAVISVVMAIETEYQIKIADRELSAEVFDTLGSLLRFISQKTAASHPNDASAP